MPITDVFVIVVGAWGLLMVIARLINQARATAAMARVSAISRINSR